MLTMTLEDQGAVLEDGRLELKGRNLEIHFLKNAKPSYIIEYSLYFWIFLTLFYLTFLLGF